MHIHFLALSRDSYLSYSISHCSLFFFFYFSFTGKRSASMARMRTISRRPRKKPGSVPRRRQHARPSKRNSMPRGTHRRPMRRGCLTVVPSVQETDQQALSNPLSLERSLCPQDLILTILRCILRGLPSRLRRRPWLLLSRVPRATRLRLMIATRLRERQKQNVERTIETTTAKQTITKTSQPPLAVVVHAL